MPPAAFIAAVSPSFPIVAGTTAISVLVPSTTKRGDTLLLLVAGATVAAGDVPGADIADLGWSTLLRVVSPGGSILTVLRRVATDTEPPGHTVRTSAVGANLASVLLVYRGLHPAAPAVAGGIVDVSGSTAFSCPSLALLYSHLYIGLAFVASGSTGVAPPAGVVPRFDTAESPPGFLVRMSAFELLVEMNGDTGLHTATAAAPATGFAAAIALATLPPIVAPVLDVDVPGAIGFVTVGV